MNKIRTAVIAGTGMLPVYWAREAVSMGMDITVLTLSEHSESVELRHSSSLLLNIAAGSLDEILRTIKVAGIRKAVMLGKITQQDLFQGMGPDDRMQRLLSAVKEQTTANILQAIAKEFESEGIELLEQTFLMDAYLPEEGILSGSSKISVKLHKDMEYGFQIAKKISTLEIGQTVIVKGGTVIAVEGMEGTDEAIRRSGMLLQGGIVAKATAVHHDFRFDVPVIGINTLREMIRAGSKALVLEAGKVIILEKAEVMRLAQENNVVVLGKRCSNA